MISRVNKLNQYGNLPWGYIMLYPPNQPKRSPSDVFSPCNHKALRCCSSRTHTGGAEQFINEWSNDLGWFKRIHHTYPQFLIDFSGKAPSILFLSMFTIYTVIYSYTTDGCWSVFRRSNYLILGLSIIRFSCLRLQALTTRWCPQRIL